MKKDEQHGGKVMKQDESNNAGRAMRGGGCWSATCGVMKQDESNNAGRAMRGGGCWSATCGCRSAYRLRLGPGSSGWDLGFRLVAGPVKSGQEPARVEQFNMVPIEAGSFVMGSPETELDRDDNEAQRKVTVAAFSMASTPVTNAQYASVITDHQVAEGDADKPVVNVSWFDAVAFCDELNKQTGGGYRLPTEEEWEYACRAGSTTAYCFGDDPAELGEYAWYGGNHTHPVAQKLPNNWGLYDMHGLVWEWCSDKYEVE